MKKILPLELGSLLEELVEELFVRSLERVAEQVDSDKFNKKKKNRHILRNLTDASQDGQDSRSDCWEAHKQTWGTRKSSGV